MNQPLRLARRRTGTTLLEVTAALGVIGLTLVAAGQLHALAVRQMVRADQHRLAVREAGNIMEHVSAVPYQQLTAQRVEALALSNEARQGLPQASLRISLAEDNDPPAKRIRVEVNWASRTGTAPAAVVLCGWRFERTGVAGQQEPVE